MWLKLGPEIDDRLDENINNIQLGLNGTISKAIEVRPHGLR